MKEPKDWVLLSKVELSDNLKGLDFSPSILENFLRDNQGKVLLFAYAKHKPGTITGIIPKIEARVISNRQNRSLKFEEFKPAAISALRSFKKNHEVYEYIVEPSETTVAGIRSVYQIARFVITTQNGTSYTVRSRTYAIPYKTYFFQISFADEPKASDWSTLFDELITSIRIGI